MMRILIHGYNYAPELTGIGRYTGELCAWLASRGHQVTALTAPPYYPEWRVHQAYRSCGWVKEWREGVEVMRAPLYVPSKVTAKGRMLLELSFGVSCLFWWPQLFCRRWDVILAVCPPFLTGLMPLWLANRQRIPLVLHFQDLQLDAARNLGILPSQKLFALLEHLERFLITQAAAVTTISRGMSARLVEKGSPAARVHLLPNWADLGHIQPIPRQNFIRRQLGISSKIIVLYAGNMGEKQGLEIILESAGLTSKRQDIRYLLVGEGAAKAKLATLARNKGLDNIIFLPLQSEQDLPFLLSSGDIHLVVQKQQAADLVMPSKLGNIMAAGRPFIATALPDTELGQVTQVSAAGLLVPPEDHQSLTRAILKLANDADLRQDMGMKARQYAEARLDRDTILPRFEKLLVHLANR